MSLSMVSYDIVSGSGCCITFRNHADMRACGAYERHGEAGKQTKMNKKQKMEE